MHRSVRPLSDRMFMEEWISTPSSSPKQCAPSTWPNRVFCGWVRRMTYNRSALAADFRTISWLDDFRPLCSNGQAQDLPTCLSRNFQPDVTFSWTSSFGFNVLLQSLLKSPPIVSPGLWMLTIFLSFTIASYYDNPPPDITDSSVKSPPNVTRF